MKNKTSIFLLVCNLFLSGFILTHLYRDQEENLESEAPEITSEQDEDRIEQILFNHERNTGMRQSIMLREILRIQEKLQIEIEPELENLLYPPRGILTIEEINRIKGLQ